MIKVEFSWSHRIKYVSCRINKHGRINQIQWLIIVANPYCKYEDKSYKIKVEVHNQKITMKFKNKIT